MTIFICTIKLNRAWKRVSVTTRKVSFKPSAFHALLFLEKEG